MKPDQKFLWKYVRGKGRQAAIKNQRFKSIERCGVPQSEWCSELWSRTNEAIAPPAFGSKNIC
tara:strand:- start:350 stop:538 length:189 start_codon:yes stop_codon:yes gene_type:complete